MEYEDGSLFCYESKRILFITLLAETKKTKEKIRLKNKGSIKQVVKR
jgi:hypothetical protein